MTEETSQEITVIEKCSIHLDWNRIEQLAAQVQQELTEQGLDCTGENHDSILDIWRVELNYDTLTTTEPQELAWYTQANEYWDDEVNCPADTTGVLGGFPIIGPPDKKESLLFLDRLKELFPNLKWDRALDCGAGIGRVTKDVLLHRFASIDLLEQSPRLLRSAEGHIQPSIPSSLAYFCGGLQDFTHLKSTRMSNYDLIWCQWVLTHLTDVDFLDFFAKCCRCLNPGGVIVIKENMLSNGDAYDVDHQDTSITRSTEYYKSLFHHANLEIIFEKDQADYPEDLIPVKMFALRPKTASSS